MKKNNSQIEKNLKGKKIVCFGGGNAMPKVVLEGLKKYPVKISAVSAMLDSGGSAGQERKEYGTQVSFGDIRRAAISLSGIKNKDKERFSYRFTNGSLSGHVVANLYCSAEILESKNFERSFNELMEDIREDLNISKDYKIIPATLNNSHLAVELEDGKVVIGEGNIDIPDHDGNLKIKNIFLVPRAKAYKGALKEIKKADLIVMGPGDLFSSLGQVFLTDGMAKAIKKSKAKKVYICNVMTKYGETNGFSVADFTKEVEKMIGTSLDYVIYNTSKPSELVIEKYKDNHKALISLVEADKGLSNKKFIGRSILKKETLDHDPKKVSEILISLV
jgi:uncharacterized cofD-like protein